MEVRQINYNCEKIENQFSWCKNIEEKLDQFRAIYEDKIEKLFKILGSFLSKHPRKTLICCTIVIILLAPGILNIEFQYDVETLYIPEDSKSLKDRNSIEALYGDPTGSNFAPYQLTRQGLYGDVLIVSKDKSSIMRPLYINEINSIDAFIREKILVEDSEMRKFRHRDICALGRSGCEVVGSILLSPKFQSDFVTGNVTFPVYNKISLNSLLAKPVSHGGVLVHTIGVRLRYYLRQNTTNASKLSKDWAKVFIKTMKTFHTNLTEIAFSHSDSLSEELDNIKESATIYFYYNITNNGCLCVNLLCDFQLQQRGESDEFGLRGHLCIFIIYSFFFWVSHGVRVGIHDRCRSDPFPYNR